MCTPSGHENADGLIESQIGYRKVRWDVDSITHLILYVYMQLLLESYFCPSYKLVEHSIQVKANGITCKRI